jgi:23S rRNA (cytidine2498-2'-O)-methyltransferase
VLASDFAFATCALGMEPFLKRELARTRPELRFAFSRPGLVTFRSPTPIAPDDPIGSVFARVWGASIGAISTPAEAASRFAALGVDRIHAFARDLDTAVDPAWLALSTGAARDGELVGNVVVAPGEPAWLALHRHDPSRPTMPGGTFDVPADPDAPSRAGRKLEEAIAWASLPIAPGDLALDIGAAPGGATRVLARRGVTVHAIDPGELAPEVAAMPGVHHHRVKLSALRWEQLPPRIDWLLLDVHLAPQVALHEVVRLAPAPALHRLRGAVITLKLNDVAFVDELPALVTRIGGLWHAGHDRAARDAVKARLRHLPANRREVCAVATA